MTKQPLIVKVSSVEESITPFKDVWDKAERGEKIENASIETVSFENDEAII